jgi:hypothetical protein
VDKLTFFFNGSLLNKSLRKKAKIVSNMMTLILAEAKAFKEFFWKT